MGLYSLLVMQILFLGDSMRDTLSKATMFFFSVLDERAH